MATTVKLQSGDGEIVTVDRDVAKISITIKTILEDLEQSAQQEEEEAVPLPKVNSATLAKVIQWCTYHRDDPPAIAEDPNKEKRTDDIPPWDQEFLRVEHGMLFELILAANYLDIKVLLDICCKSLAHMLKGKTPDEIRKTFHIKNDFTPQEEEQIRKENEWCGMV